MIQILKLQKKHRGRVLYYTVAVWFSLSFLGYGLSLRQYDQIKLKAENVFAQGRVESRESLFFGLGGQTCIVLENRPTRFCYRSNYIDRSPGGPGNVYSQLKPGTWVKLNATAGKIFELTVESPHAPPKNLISAHRASPIVKREIYSGSSSNFYMVIGILLLPLMILLRRFGPYLLEKVAPLRGKLASKKSS